jgi:predicted cupin superfamily sugar epimerase
MSTNYKNMNTQERKNELIQSLGLLSHPEGGYYKETYRSVETIDGEQALMTSILFLLTSENASNFHRIQSDEHWYFHEGSPLIVHVISENGHEQKQLGLDLSAGQSPYQLVHKQEIFGSEVQEEGGYALVSCAVAPGFMFRDFELFTRQELLDQYPQHEEIICRLT